MMIGIEKDQTGTGTRGETGAATEVIAAFVDGHLISARRGMRATRIARED
jgi:hypothetical protein